MLFCRGKESAEGDSKIEQSEVKKDISSKGTYISHTKRLHNIHQSHGDRDTWIFFTNGGPYTWSVLPWSTRTKQ